MSCDLHRFPSVPSISPSAVVSASLLSGLGFSQIDRTLNSKQEQNLNRPQVADT